MRITNVKYILSKLAFPAKKIDYIYSKKFIALSAKDQSFKYILE